MLVLLPPSEGKSAAQAGPALDLAALSLPSLTPARQQVLAALTGLCAGDREHARATLGLSSGQAAEVDRDAALRSAPTAPAAQVYSGVLYQALGVDDLGRAARRRLDQWVLVWSGLWGAVGLSDPIPAYRLAGGVRLPPLGPLGTFWRPHLAAALADRAEQHVILDLRSGTYAASWTGPAATTVIGRVVHEHAGRRTVASHANKATKGRVVRALAEVGDTPATPADLVDALRAAGVRAEPSEPARGRRPAVLDLVVDAL